MSGNAGQTVTAQVIEVRKARQPDSWPIECLLRVPSRGNLAIRIAMGGPMACYDLEFDRDFEEKVFGETELPVELVDAAEVLARAHEAFSTYHGPLGGILAG